MTTSVDWEGRLAEVERRNTKLAALPLSMFGRGLSVAGYAVSTLLYHAEFAGLPPDAQLQRLQSQLARVVEHAQAPGAATPRRFTGIGQGLLAGSPKGGGFGMLPLVEHVQARWARRGAELICSDGSKQWVQLARALIYGGRAPSDSSPLALLRLPRASLAPPLARLQAGLQALPPLDLTRVAAGGE
jgi:hypothetical protein